MFKLISLLCMALTASPVPQSNLLGDISNSLFKAFGNTGTQTLPNGVGGTVTGTKTPTSLEGMVKDFLGLDLQGSLEPGKIAGSIKDSNGRTIVEGSASPQGIQGNIFEGLLGGVLKSDGTGSKTVQGVTSPI